MSATHDNKTTKAAIDARFRITVEEVLKQKKAASPTEMGVVLGISPQSFTEIMKERQGPTTPVVQKLCKEYGVNIGFIFFNEQPMFTEIAPTPAAKTGKQQKNTENISEPHAHYRGTVSENVSLNVSHGVINSGINPIITANQETIKLIEKLRTDHGIEAPNMHGGIDLAIYELKLLIIEQTALLREFLAAQTTQKSTRKSPNPRDVM